MRLFDMSSADIDAAAEAHYDKMYDDYFGFNKPEPECSNCQHYYGGQCWLHEDEDIDPDDKEPDEYCDSWERMED